MRTLIKQLVLGGSRALGVQAWLRWRHRRSLLVLCYHGVVAEVPAGREYLYRNTVTVAELDAQLGCLTRLFRPVDAAAVVAAVTGGEPLPERAVLVTFDDGYRNNLTRAAPLLVRHSVPALVSVATDYIGSDAMLWPMAVDLLVEQWPAAAIPGPGGGTVPVPADPAGRAALARRIRRGCKVVADADRRRYLEELHSTVALDLAAVDDELWRFMSWDEVRALRGHGVTIASHTASHPILARVADDRLPLELAVSKARIEAEVGAPCDALVFPNGDRDDVSAAVLAAVAAAGYRAAFTLTEKRNRQRPPAYGVDRVAVPVGATPAVFYSRISGLYSLLSARSA